MQVADVRRDIDAAVQKLKKHSSKGERATATRNLRELRKELRERETEAISSILRNADVVLATLTSASPDGPLRHTPPNHFDVAVIDECSQVSEYCSLTDRHFWNFNRS